MTRVSVLGTDAIMKSLKKSERSPKLVTFILFYIDDMKTLLFFSVLNIKFFQNIKEVLALQYVKYLIRLDNINMPQYNMYGIKRNTQLLTTSCI